MAELVTEALEQELERDHYWPAQLAVVAAIVLYVALPAKLTVGPEWLVPVSEGLLLVVLVYVTPYGRRREDPRRRRVALVVTLIAAAANLASLALLVNYVVTHTSHEGGRLVLSGAEIWVTNVLIFAVAFWELDGGGPEARVRMRFGPADLLFQQHTLDVPRFKRWRPRFPDYLYTSFTNCTAFSPTDTMPLSTRMKTLFLVQALAALTTIGVVLARAISALG